MSSIKLFVAIVPLIGKRETEREIKEWNSRGTPQWRPWCGSNRSQVTSRVKDREEISEKPVIKGKFVGMYPYCLMVFINKKCIFLIFYWKKWWMNEKSNYYIYKYKLYTRCHISCFLNVLNLNNFWGLFFQFLHYFAFCHEDCPDDFHIVTNFPRRTLPCEPSEEGPDPPSFVEAGLGKNEMLFVQDNEAWWHCVNDYKEYW